MVTLKESVMALNGYPGRVMALKGYCGRVSDGFKRLPWKSE